MLTFTLYNETGKDIDTNDMMKSQDNDDSPNEDDFKPQKRNKKFDKNKTKPNIYDNAANDIISSEDEKINNTNFPVSAKKKIKKESPEEEVENIFKMESSSEVENISQQKSKFIYKIIYDNTKNREFSQIGLDELWTLVSKNKDFSKHNIKNKQDLLGIVNALDVQGKCLYSEEDKSITLV